MNKAIRSLAIAGMSLAAGAMIGVGPVHAAPATDQAAGSNAGYQAQSWADYDYVVGYFRWQRSCRNAGWTGIKYGAWDKYKCSPVRVSWRGWAWKLQVRQEYWNWDDWDGGWPGDWPYKPDYVGSPFDVGQPYKHNGFPWKNYKGTKFDHWKDAPGDKYHDKYQDQYPQGPHDKYQDQDWKYPQGQHDKVKDWKGMP